MPKDSEITLGYVHDRHRVERRNAAISVLSTSISSTILLRNRTILRQHLEKADTR